MGSARSKLVCGQPPGVSELQESQDQGGTTSYPTWRPDIWQDLVVGAVRRGRPSGRTPCQDRRRQGRIDDAVRLHLCAFRSAVSGCGGGAPHEQI